VGASPSFPDLWALNHLRLIPPPAKLIILAVILIIAIPRANRLIRDMMQRSQAAFISRKTLKFSILALCSFALFWSFRSQNMELGDSAYIIKSLTLAVHTRGYHVSYDEPLELLLHSTVFHIIHRYFDRDVADTYALLSSVCGILYIFIIVAFSRRITSSHFQFLLILGLLLSPGSIQLFFGYVENYTIVAAAIVFYFYLAYRCIRGEIGLLPPALVLSVSFCLHVLAGWLLPSLLYLWWIRTREKDFTSRVTAMVKTTGIFIAPIVATVVFLTYLGTDPSYFKATHLWNLDFIFLQAPGSNTLHHSMASAGHVMDVINELLLTALPGLAMIVYTLGVHHRRIQWRDPFLLSMLTSSLFLQIFAGTWNPDLGAYRDWDLFAIIGFSHTLLGVYLWTQSVPDTSRSRYAGVFLLAICLAFSATWIYANSRPGMKAENGHDDAHLILANDFYSKGNLMEAEKNYREAVRVNPGNPMANLNLAELSLRNGNQEEAVRFFQRYLEIEPDGQFADRVRKKLGTLQGSIQR
jgi:hypothetical protein